MTVSTTNNPSAATPGSTVENTPPAPLSAIGSLRYGITLPLRALQVIRKQPKLIALSLIPAVLTFFIYGVLIIKLQSAVDVAIHDFLSTKGVNAQEGFFGGLTWSLVWLSRLVLFVGGALTFSFTAALVSTPFNDFLAEAAEPHTEPPLPAVPSAGFTWRVRLLWIDLLKTLMAGGIAAISFVMTWVPVLNVIAIIMSCLMLTFQFISYAQTRRGLGFTSGAKFLFSHFLACLGFGSALMVLLAIPLVSCAVIPIAVVGGTLLVGRFQRHR